ncbi:HotDog domain-containing protein [Exophiala viscosa]|uniref:HotDog domain-containing protein n=1 Tax=Exophiala viscosa TaxID=2486360 RepID=A0AAN6DUV3_9EURO|nr:HotDog domain-containing protein [Exophiala viscosa]KAI1623089.1 HotDog domain-containing protein [Exophiala viscosa]
MTHEMDFMSRFITSHRVPEDARNHFASIEWTNKHLSNPLYTAIPTFSRELKESGEDYFFSRTVSSPSTIPHLVTLQLKEFPVPRESPRGTLKTGQNHTKVTEVPENPDCIMLLTLGRPGLDGHPSVIHGGMACAILDEMMGLCIMLHHQHISGPRDSLFTANLNVTYRAPVPTPNDVLVRCWLVGREGRKWLSRGQIVDKDGLVMTEAEGLWVLTKRQDKL